MLRVGLIGLGYIGGVHARSIVANPRMRLIAVHARSASSRESFAAQYGARPVDRFEALVTAPDVDAVIIASSTDSHSDMAIQIARAGKPMYCEKPIDLNLERAKKTVEAIKAFNVPVMIGFNRRYAPSHAAVQREVQAGRVGKLHLLQMTSRGPQSPPPLEYLKKSGGFFRDKGVHFFDLARFIAEDEVVEVSAMGAALAHPFIGELGDYDTSVAILRMGRGTLCQIDNARTAVYGYDERIEAFGPGGMVESCRVPQVGFRRTQGTSLVNESFPQNNFDRVGESFARAMDAFASWILDGTGRVPTIDDALAAQTIAEAATLSAVQHRVVSITELCASR